jgi:hypothetical protein
MPAPGLLGSTILTNEATEDSTLPCFAASGEQTAPQLRERFQQGLTHPLVAEHVDKLIDASLGSTWTRLYDSVSPHTHGPSRLKLTVMRSISTTLSPSYDLSSLPLVAHLHNTASRILLLRDIHKLLSRDHLMHQSNSILVQRDQTPGQQTIRRDGRT